MANDTKTTTTTTTTATTTSNDANKYNDESNNTDESSPTDIMIKNTQKDQDNEQHISSLKRLKKDKEYRHKFIHTMVLCWSFVTYGWIAGMTGPTFPDLRQLINEDLATSTWMFTVGSFGFMVGSLGGGVLFDRINKEALLAVSLCGVAIAQIVTPFCRILATMLVVRFFTGIFCGVIDTGGNADIYYVWGKDGESFMQALHFGFSIGALLAPLATEPFLAEKINICLDNSLPNTTSATPSDSQPHLSNLTYHNATAINKTVSVRTCTDVYEESNVQYAFILSGVLCMTSSVAFLCLLCCSGNAYKTTKVEKTHKDIEHHKVNDETNDENNEDDNVNNKQDTEGDKDKHTTNNRKKLTRAQTTFFLAMACLQISSYAIIEDTFAGFLMTFSLAHLDWNKSNGSFATSAFWIAFAVGRFLGIFITKFCKQTLMLTVYLTLMGIALVGFFIGVKFLIMPMVWIFIIILGFSMSVLFPSFFSWTTKNVIPLKGKITSLIFVCLILTGMGFPIIMGNLMEYFGPMWFVYILLLAMGYCLVHFTVLRILVRAFIMKKSSKHETDDKETEMTLIK